MRLQRAEDVRQISLGRYHILHILSEELIQEMRLEELTFPSYFATRKAQNGRFSIETTEPITFSVVLFLVERPRDKAYAYYINDAAGTRLEESSYVQYQSVDFSKVEFEIVIERLLRSQ